MKRDKYFINPTEAGWELKKQGADRATKTFETKNSALDYSRDFVGSKDNSQLIIKKQNGVIQTEHTYGNDPEKYKG
jgi:hypothetical protein